MVQISLCQLPLSCSPRNELITNLLGSFLPKCLDFHFLPLGYFHRCRILSCQVFMVFFQYLSDIFYLLLAPIITIISPSLNHVQAVSFIAGVVKFSLVCRFHKSDPDVSWCEFLWAYPLEFFALVLALMLLFHCLPVVIISLTVTSPSCLPTIIIQIF